MDEFGFPPLEVEQATMVRADAADLGKCEERIIKRLKGKGVFGEIPFMLRLQTSRHLLDREISKFVKSSIPFSFSFANSPVSESEFLNPSIQRTNPQLMGGFIPTRSLTGIDLDNLDTEISMSDIVNNT